MDELKNDSSNLSMLTKYADFMKMYEITMWELESINVKELNDKEYKLYIETHFRISNRLTNSALIKYIIIEYKIHCYKTLGALLMAKKDMNLKDFVEVVSGKKDIDIVKSIFDDEIHYKRSNNTINHKHRDNEHSDEFDTAEDFGEEYEDDYDSLDEAEDEYYDEREDEDY